MPPIAEAKVNAIKDLQSLIDFLRDELDWNIPQDAFIEDISYEWTGSELNLCKDRQNQLKDGCIRQLKKLRADQPLAIFLVDFQSEHLYTTTLRQILRHFAIKQRGSNPDIPMWAPANMLFICTTGNYQEFTYTHFYGDKPDRARMTSFSWSPGEPMRTVCEYNLPALHYDPDLNTVDWQKQWLSAFDVEKVTRQFFADYKQVFESLQNLLVRQLKKEDTREAQTWAHDYSLQLLNRIMFIYFIQKKKWLGGKSHFIYDFWKAYRSSTNPPDTFSSEWLSVLFFEAFNNKYQNRAEYVKRFGKEINVALSEAPWLNGGLYSQNDLDTKYSFNIPDSFFILLFDEFEGRQPGFFERYNFTISETTPLDQEVAIDPEMIGRVYESLVNITFEGKTEEDLKATSGIVYTPRVEIDMMCRLSLVDFLSNHLGTENRALLYEVVLAYYQMEKQQADSRAAAKNLWPMLQELLTGVTVLDPACGSGSFPVGMLLILDDLIQRAQGQLGLHQSPFERRKNIIANSLYGVDVMTWAVHVAELRLWLQLVVETDLKPHEMKVEPVLPRLSFKLRPGDSLVQEVGGLDFSQPHKDLDISSQLKGKLTNLKGEKAKFYRNDPEAKYKDETALKQQELQIFREIIAERARKIEERITELNERIKSPRAQASLAGLGPVSQQAPLEVQGWKKEIEERGGELSELKAAYEAILKEKEPPFVWEIAFVEVFQGDKQGFDIVIGNPPYVRQEMIAPPLKKPDDYGGEKSDRWKELKSEYKGKLQKSIYSSYKNFFGYNPNTGVTSHKLDGKSDLYIFFYFHGLKLLNAKGSFCFITSNSWLDVGYGKDLQEFLLRHSHIKMILDNQYKRSFATAGINTIIALLAAPDDSKNWGLDKDARFIMFKIPFEEALSAVIFQEIEEAIERRNTPDYRILPVPQKTLLESGLEIGDNEEEERNVKKRGKALPGDFNKALKYACEKWGGKYLRGPDIFFKILDEHSEYLCKFGSLVSHMQRNNLQNLKYVEHTERAICPSGFPFLHSVKDVDTIRINPNLLPKVIPSKNQRNVTYLIPDVISNRFIGAKLCFFEGGDFLIHDTFFIATLKEKVNKYITLASLNSTLSLMILEQLGRKNMGEGVLCIYGPDLANHIILSPNKITGVQAKFLEQCYEKIAIRPIQPILDELNMEDRKILDECIFDILRLTQGERDAVYEAIIGLVEARLKKAASL